MAQENHHYERCARCRFCDEEALQMTVRNCSAVANTVCGCKPGLFPSCWDHGCVDPGEHLLCSPCADCGTLNRRPLAACEDPLDAAPPRWPPPTPGPPRHLLPAVSQGQEECGGCLDGFYEHDKECVSCPKITLGSCPKPCASVCGWRQMFWVQVLLAVLVVPLLLGAPLIYTYHRCHAAGRVESEEARTEALLPPQDSAHSLPPLPSGPLAANSWMPGPFQAPEAPCPADPWVKNWLPSPALGPPPAPAAGREAAVLQPGPQLYDVIDAVPARCWKEFVRTLGLREAEIEAVEVEVDRFRDQQYEMLKRWRQQESAGLDAVYRALERMGLHGCAESLRERLQRGA
ncbi:tumor necrosis factor receptor superfamily member 25 isoform X2 [Sorex araneus]|uniref:tumor necrosis factor receptor superfamily member 25 isoform X2 n=1 Tax=Sorex araneus TaxID=42254 RepID=UPI0024336B24|nr:tumor necrosis factor receptor superfamily member 25 isoform X2 [Sorex araneus]